MNKKKTFARRRIMLLIKDFKYLNINSLEYFQRKNKRKNYIKSQKFVWKNGK